jgi:hypothetical protein
MENHDRTSDRTKLALLCQLHIGLELVCSKRVGCWSGTVGVESAARLRLTCRVMRLVFASQA